MEPLQILADVAIGVLVFAIYFTSWVAWLTLGIFPFVVAGLLYLAGRYGVPALVVACVGLSRRAWTFVLEAALQLVPRHAAT